MCYRMRLSKHNQHLTSDQKVVGSSPTGCTTLHQGFTISAGPSLYCHCTPTVPFRLFIRGHTRRWKRARNFKGIQPSPPLPYASCWPRYGLQGLGRRPLPLGSLQRRETSGITKSFLSLVPDPATTDRLKLRRGAGTANRPRRNAMQNTGMASAVAASLEQVATPGLSRSCSGRS